MVGMWVVVLPLLVDFNGVTLQPVTKETRQVDRSGCCPCPDTPAQARGSVSDDWAPEDCPCGSRANDAEASASILLPALRAMQPFVKQPDQKTERKPLLQPEVGLASSVLETLQQATNEEYEEALARDAARSAVQLIESALDPDDPLIEIPKNNVRIYLNTQGDDMDDNLPEPSHIQETRCIHSPLKSIHNNGQLRTIRPVPIVEVIDLSPNPTRKLKNKKILHRNFLDMDNGIGASNIQERVMQPNLDHILENGNLKSNPALLSLFTLNHFEKTDDQKGLQKNLGNEYNLSQKSKPNIHLKLRELMDNLDVISKKEKSKIPITDFKNHISTTTRSPPIKFKPIENLIYNNKPAFLKNVLKLKDVELIPQNTLTRNTAVKKPLYPNLKLYSKSSRGKSFNPDTDNCKEDSNNPAPIMNTDIKMTIDKFSPDIIDTETSPSNSIPLNSKNNDNIHNFQQNFIPVECIANSDNSDVNGISPTPIGVEGQDNFDNGEIKLEEDSNTEHVLSDNCNAPTQISYIYQSLNNENQKQSLYNNSLPKGQEQKLKGTEDMTNGDSNDEVFQIQLIEDLDTPIEFDNSSFIPKTHLKNNNNIGHTTTTNEENTFEDHIAETSNNYLQIEKQSNENPDMSQLNLKKNFDDCDFQESLTGSLNYVSEQETSMEKSQDINAMLPESPEDDINRAQEMCSEVNEEPRHVSFRDLQDMSNIILNLSEHEPSKKENINIKSNRNKDLDQFNNDYDIQSTALSTEIFETNSKETKGEDGLNNKLKADSKFYRMSGIESNEKACKSNSAEILSNTNDKKSINSIVPDSEMRAEASEYESQLYNSVIPSFRNNVENDKKFEIFEETSADVNNITNINKHSNFLNNLKSKLGMIFSTTEKVTSGIMNSPDDNTNESSNINQMVASFDKFKNFDNFQRTPQTPLREISSIVLPGKSLNSLKNKLALPNYVEQPLTTNSRNFLRAPLEVSRPFDTLDPNLAFTALSDKLRSHTENAIQNVKETIESSLKDSQSFRLSRPAEILDTNDILESLSQRRDDMKEKLEAIHTDLNDRFSSFQQSIVNHFNVPNGNSELREGMLNGGSSSSYIPIRKELSRPGASQFRNAKQERHFLPHRVGDPAIGKSTEISLMSSKNPEASATAQFKASDRKALPDLMYYSTTTAIPSFIPRPKVLRTNIDSSPRLTSERLSNARPSKPPILFEEEATKIKPLLLKPSRTSNFLEKSFSSPGSTSTINVPGKSSKTNTDIINTKDLSIDYPVNNLRKTLLQKNQNQKSRNDFTKSHQSVGTSNSLVNNGHSNAKLSRMKEGRSRIVSRNDDELVISPTSHVDTIHPSRNEAELRLVEPMKENVPYKCKLICYKDS